MRIQRSRSNLTFRARRRRTGCLPTALFLLVMAGVATFSWDWISEQLNLRPSPQGQGDLRGALSAFDRGDLDTAISLARNLWTLNPAHTEALILLVRALIYRSYDDYNRGVDRELALELTTEAYERLTTDGDVAAIHALALHASGESVEAAQVVNRVLQADPDNTLARIVLALAYGGVGSHERALNESQIAVNSGEWPLDALRALAISYSDLGMYEQAKDTVEEALALNDRLLLLHFERALYSLQQSDDDAATVSYFQVMAFDPENAKARLRLCELSSIRRERDTAMRYCGEVTEIAPAWADGWYHLGREYFLQGDFPNAQRSLHRCSSLQLIQNVPVEQRRFECWYLQGQAAEILGDCEGLLSTYNEFRQMAASAALPQTWTYPPEGPSICVGTPA
jgi:tetratricopeptide (TPR) repeat protein